MYKVLVIEDEAPLREEIVDWLRFEDFEVFAAGDGVAGVEVALLERPDIILSDIQMPRMDGYGVLLEMRSNVATSHIPFVFFTARASREDVRHGMALGADDYLTKPFTHAELLGAVRSRLEKKDTQEQEFQQQIDIMHQAMNAQQEHHLFQSRMISMFSHDFRNTLASVMSANSLLRDYGDRMTAERRMSGMNQIENSVRQMIHMLDDIMIVGQMETGYLKCTPEPTDLAHYLGGIVQEAELLDGGTRPIIFEGQYSNPVKVDRKLLRQIVSNLLSNAVKYSQPGTEIRLSLQYKPEELIVEVCDHGMGIPAEDQPKLFELFQRASNVGQIPGTGLGLAIVKQATDLHGGRITFHSQVGEGTTFTIALPLE